MRHIADAMVSTPVMRGHFASHDSLRPVLAITHSRLL